MSETSTTTYSPEVTGAIVAHGLMSLGMHMAEHGLPPFTGVQTPRPGWRADIELHIADAASLDAWVESIEVDRTEIVPRDSEPFPFGRRYHGRLPSTGVRVVLLELLTEMPRGIGGLLEVVSS